MSNYNKYEILCDQFLLSCSRLIVNHITMSPTLNVDPTLFVIPGIFLDEYRFIVLQLLSLTK